MYLRSWSHPSVSSSPFPLVNLYVCGSCEPSISSPSTQLAGGPPISSTRGVQSFGISAPHWKKRSCLRPHIKYIVTHSHKKSHNVLSKFMILSWATFIAILSHMWPIGHRLVSPVRAEHPASQGPESCISEQGFGRYNSSLWFWRLLAFGWQMERRVGASEPDAVTHITLHVCPCNLCPLLCLVVINTCSASW